MSENNHDRKPSVICPSVDQDPWSISQMVEIVSAIKWFRSFSFDTEESFFSESPPRDQIKLTTLSLSLAGDLLEEDRIHGKLWILNRKSNPSYTWMISPSGENLGVFTAY